MAPAFEMEGSLCWASPLPSADGSDRLGRARQQVDC